MQRQYSILPFLLTLTTIIQSADCRCGERLERALDLMQQRGNSARRRYDPDEADIVYREKLRSAPIEVSVTKVQVEIPNSPSSSSSSTSNSRDGLAWAKVESCAYEPNNNSVRTRVAFNELAVTGIVRLVAHEPTISTTTTTTTNNNVPYSRRFTDRLLPAESCRMSLRLRRAGMEFYTSPIARGRGQMRIRTESSFLEPRFASIYAYGCRPVATVTRGLLRPSRHPINYDRIVESEPRELDRGLGYAGLSINNDYNSVTNLSAFDDETNNNNNNNDNDDNEEIIDFSDHHHLDNNAPLLNADEDEEENRLGSTTNDAILDNLWRSRSDIAREMEDVFLRSASQAITHYIERQLHPAIKETLMLSMGYTISYG